MARRTRAPCGRAGAPALSVCALRARTQTPLAHGVSVALLPRNYTPYVVGEMTLEKILIQGVHA